MTKPSKALHHFLVVFLCVFTLSVGVSMINTRLTPKAYAATARIAIESREDKPIRPNKRLNRPAMLRKATAVVNSELILNRVIKELNLNEAWGKKYYSGENRKTWESLKILQGRMYVRPLADTTLIQVRIYDDNPAEAAILANAVARAYVGYAATNAEEPLAQMADAAFANPVPVSPNKAKNLVVGIFAGIVLGLVSGSGVVWWGALGKSRELPPENI